MASTNVHIIGGGTYVGTAIMRALHAMSCNVTGSDLHHRHATHYLQAWNKEKCSLIIGTAPAITSEEVIICIASDYILKHELPTKKMWDSVRAHVTKKIPDAKNIRIIMPIDKHETQLSQNILKKYFGDRSEDTRIAQLSKLFERLTTDISNLNKHAHVTKVYISDVYGKDMPISKNHKLFYALSQYNASSYINHEDKELIMEKYFPTHIDDLCNGIIKLLFTSSNVSEISLINPQSKGYAEVLHDLHVTDTSGWSFAPDYPVNTDRITKTNGLIHWYPKHAFKFRQSVRTSALPIKIKKASHHVTESKHQTHVSSKSRILLGASISIILIFALLPAVELWYNYHQLDRAIKQHDTKEVIETSEKTIQTLENTKWLLTLLQKRSKTEELISELKVLQSNIQTIHVIEGLIKAGYALIGKTISNEYVPTAIQTWIDTASAVEPLNTLQSKDTDEHILGYATSLNEGENALRKELTQVGRLFAEITSQANEGIFAEVVNENTTTWYRLTTGAKGLVASEESPTTTEKYIQINAQLLANTDLPTWVNNLGTQLQSEHRNEAITLIQNGLTTGAIRIIDNSLPCSNSANLSSTLCITMNQSGAVAATQYNNVLTIQINASDLRNRNLVIHLPVAATLQNIQDGYLRELDTVTRSQNGKQTTFTYETPEDTTSNIKITLQVPERYAYLEVYQPITTPNVSRLYIPIKSR